jgi:hypothetical protein
MTGAAPLKWRAISEIPGDLLLLDYDLRAAPWWYGWSVLPSSHSFLDNFLLADNPLGGFIHGYAFKGNTFTTPAMTAIRARARGDIMDRNVE